MRKAKTCGECRMAVRMTHGLSSCPVRRHFLGSMGDTFGIYTDACPAFDDGSEAERRESFNKAVGELVEAARCVANDEGDAETQQEIQRIEIGGNP